MVRLLSGLLLVLAVIACLLLLSSWQLLIVAEVVLLIAFVEYARLAEALGARIPRTIAAAGAAAACAALALSAPLELTLLAVVVVGCGSIVGLRQPSRDVLTDVAATMFPTLYLGLPLGSIVAIHALAGSRAVLLLLLATIVSDTAQYYSGRAFGRHKLSPAISPNKTVEGAIGGFLVTPPVLALVGRSWLPGTSPWHLLLVGLALVGFGMVGDLFESLLKRSAGVKDSSGLIPGHGGMLDRVDSLLFAAPVFYLFLRFTT